MNGQNCFLRLKCAEINLIAGQKPESDDRNMQVDKIFYCPAFSAGAMRSFRVKRRYTMQDLRVSTVPGIAFIMLLVPPYVCTEILNPSSFG